MQTEAYANEFDTIAIALLSSALFEQYDEQEPQAAANDDIYENLYPNPA